MAVHEHKSAICLLPALAGLGLAAGAIALLTSDAITTGHWSVTHALQPILVIGAIAAAVMCHRSMHQWHVFSALLFLVIAVFGSAVTMFATLGRSADARDTKISEALAANRQLVLVEQSLTTAKADAARECKSGFGTRCTNAQGRVDQLTKEMASQRTVATDARADAIADLLHLIAGADKANTRAIVAALDPILLPAFLELGSIVFFAFAFPIRRRALQTIAPQASAIEVQSFTRDEALQDLRTMREAGSGKVLAARWGVDPATVTRWLQSFEEIGAIERNRAGKAKAVLALPPPRRQRVVLAKIGPAFSS